MDDEATAGDPEFTELLVSITAAVRLARQFAPSSFFQHSTRRRRNATQQPTIDDPTLIVAPVGAPLFRAVGLQTNFSCYGVGPEFILAFFSHGDDDLVLDSEAKMAAILEKLRAKIYGDPNFGAVGLSVTQQPPPPPPPPPPPDPHLQQQQQQQQQQEQQQQQQQQEQKQQEEEEDNDGVPETKIDVRPTSFAEEDWRESGTSFPTSLSDGSDHRVHPASSLSDEGMVGLQTPADAPRRHPSASFTDVDDDDDDDLTVDDDRPPPSSPSL